MELQVKREDYPEIGTHSDFGDKRAPNEDPNFDILERGHDRLLSKNIIFKRRKEWT